MNFCDFWILLSSFISIYYIIYIRSITKIFDDIYIYRLNDDEEKDKK